VRVKVTFESFFWQSFKRLVAGFLAAMPPAAEALDLMGETPGLEIFHLVFH